MMSLLILIFEFFKIGLFSIGGGLATLPFLYRLADKYPWFSAKQIPDMIAVSESTPGPLGINMATYTGFTVEGLLGALISTVGLVLPSLIVIIVIAHFLEKFQESNPVKYAFYGLRPAVAGLIAAAAFQVIKVSVLNIDLFKETGRLIDIIDIRAFIICVAVLILLNIKKLKKIHPIVYILCGAVLGILVF